MPAPVHIEVLYDLDEQHLPLLITVGATAEATLPRGLRKRTDWTSYQAQLKNLSVGQLTTPEEVEMCATELTNAIRKAKADATTIQPRTSWREVLPANLQRMRAKKRKLRELWARTRCPTTKTELNQLAENLSNEVKKWRGNSWDERIEQVTEDQTNLYTLNRQLLRAKVPICPLMDATGKRLYAADERAELLADHLETQFHLHPIPRDTDPAVTTHHNDVTNQMAVFLQTPAPPLDGDIFISPAEVTRAVRRLQAKKAPGLDEVTNADLKQMPSRGLVCIARLFNGILRTRYFPQIWKTGKVILLPKPGKDRRQPSSYRPITLLPHLAKLFERLLLRRLYPHFTPREEQFGFRTRHSTTLQLTRVLHHLAYEHNLGRRSVAVFLDIEKAFDRVWHEGLLFKLSRTPTPAALIHTIASFLTDRQFCVSVEGVNSGLRPIAAGVPQGSCLSPHLYAVYTDDIPVLGEENLKPGERGATLALFADDSAYITSSVQVKIAANRMQRMLDLLPMWLDKWRMAVNVGKTAALLTGAQRILPPPLQLRGQDVAWETSTKYLGVFIDRTLRMRRHVDHAVHQAKAARALLRPVLQSKLPLHTKTGIYKTYIRTKLTYAAPAWYALCQESQRKRLEVVQNVTLRMCTGAGRYVRNDVIARDVKIETVREFVVRMARRQYDCADNGPHPHLNNIAPHHARPPDDDVSTRRALPRDLVPVTVDEESVEEE